MITGPALVPQANLSPPFPDLHALHTQLKRDSRLPSSIFICAQDPDTRLHSTAHEARRLIYILLGFGIPLESWMTSTTSQGIMIREEAIAIIYPLLSGRRIGQLREAGLQVQCTVSEATSDEEEPSIATSRIKGSLPSGAFDASGQCVRIVDTHLDRILRNPHAEKSRLIEMVAGLTNIEPEKLAGDASSFQSSLGSGSMLSLSYDTSKLLHWDNSSLLGRAGLGDVQLAGPIALSHGLSALSLSQDSFDWSALKSEVSKMKFPWEAETPSLTNQSISQPCAMSTKNHASSPSGGPFMQLLRPLHWSSSSSVFSKMASAGLRWDPSGRPEESSDETDSQHSMD
ncbi:hypothetical protein CPB86DRAFT_158253 [Serendipita vermifera]|nr:hypothetical protein CPB86DRAFT_158253 [Serendipita vermifera]